jgi:UDP-N-acetylmuramoyl-tripeptide--D-alanyl-D-alanine ligase
MATPIPSNRCGLSAAEIIDATGASAPAAAVAGVHGVSIDSRTIAAGALFVALRGNRDGHEFLERAAARGAAAAIVERGRAGALPCFETTDTLAALGELARYHLARVRAAHPLPTIAIGGAAGKTSTKELTAALARALFGEILSTPGNLNNRIGVPMTLLTLNERQRAAVIECGTNQRGEIARLAAMVRPDVALVLNVDIEHTEGLGSLEGVADEEAALYAGARVAVVGTDEALLRERIPAGSTTLTFGTSSDADVRLAHRKVIGPGHQQIVLTLPPSMVESGADPNLQATLGLLGAASAMNAAAAVAAVIAAYGRPVGAVERAALSAALGYVRPVEGRLSTREIADIIVIDDTYNANPRSVRAALAAARETAEAIGARLLVALGDMLELGALSAAMHAEIVRDVNRARPAALVAVGPEMAAAINRDTHDPAVLIRLAADSAAAAAVVREIVRPGDVLLVKGSRGIVMERIIEGLTASLDAT